MSDTTMHAFAVVESVETDGLRLKFDGEDTAGEKSYKCNTFFKFSAGDRVYCVKDSGTYVAICKIGEPAPKIVADTAETAKKAESAETADSVESAKEAEQLAMYNDTLYKIMFKTNSNSTDDVYYAKTYNTQGTVRWYPLGAPKDESATYATDTAIVRFRSTAAGKLEFLLPFRNAYTWYTIATE